MFQPNTIIFDVNETLSDMSTMAQRFIDVGAPGDLAATWFAGVLRDGFALAAVGATRSFADIASGLLAEHLYGLPLNRDAKAATEHIVNGFTTLEPHPDVAGGITALASSGVRLITLSNGAESVAEGVLQRAGVRASFERVLSVDAAGLWKPAARAYAYALSVCDVEPADAVLVAVHPWDIDGAVRAGLRTAWLNRTGRPYPDYFKAPDLTASSLTELAALLNSHAVGRADRPGPR